MSPSTTATPGTEIPRWPKITASLDADGSGTLTIDGRTQKLAASDITAARATVLERVTATAATIGRPVRLLSTDPDGRWELAVHPGGRVDELAAHPRAAASPPGVADTTPPPPPAPSVPRGTRERPPLARGRLARRLVAAAALLIGVSAAAALIVTNGPATVVSEPITPRVLSTPHAVVVQEDVRAAALARAHRRAIAQRRRARAALEHRVAVRQAREKRAARRHAAARRSARNARRRAAAARRRAAARARRRASSVHAAPTRAGPRPARPPAPSTACGEFDLC